jgi:hypothetical protein
LPVGSSQPELPWLSDTHSEAAVPSFCVTHGVQREAVAASVPAIATLAARMW